MMNIILDENKFDTYQRDLIRALLFQTRLSLKNTAQLQDVDKDVLDDICENIVFNVCTVLDGSDAINEDKASVHLCFTSDDGKTLITHEGGGWSHEYVFGVTLALEEDDK